MATLVHIHPADNVAVALRPIKAGETLEVEGTGAVCAAEDIPQGHKMAVRSIAAGENVVKYGLPIGHATVDVEPGTWMHTHNVRTNLSGEVSYEYHPTHPVLEGAEPETFMGFRTADGRAATRNEIWIIPTVGCVNEVARALTESCQDLIRGSVDGVYYFPHPFGCSQTGADHAQTRRLLVALSRHPNAAGVLFLSLGCENCTHQQVLDELGDFDHERVRFLTCQDVEDEQAEGRRIVGELIDAVAGRTREPISVSELVVGMKCGGSDGLSGITANPVIGRVSDMVVARGGSTVLTEVPEMFGAESFLLDRCENEAVFRAAADMLNGFKDYFISHGEVVYENPSPGNKDGGITTLEDKSCGCVQKGGSAPIVDVLPYGASVEKRGLNLLCGPGNDMVSTTALTAAGCHVILFSTGRGTPFGAPAPTLKVFTNSDLSRRKANWMDFNAGVVADGARTLDEAAHDLYDLVLRCASGERTSAERRGCHEIAIWKDGVTL
ncbi:altronate dehydratase [Collinsella tanakaei]|uniref:UxaA family hydrolase n=1 Tax=Collinsella tanakaei TaxID=626935 RepID=UPI00195E4ACA|nr:altronate dehydratase family protein [Collinsella tanakaei]MBM6754934.1 altronate dehydratase [Collinsella tanakaei]